MLEAMAEPSPEGELSTGTERGDGGGAGEESIDKLGGRATDPSKGATREGWGSAPGGRRATSLEILEKERVGRLG